MKKKNLFSYWMAVVAILMSVALVGCNPEDDPIGPGPGPGPDPDPNTEVKIVGSDRVNFTVKSETADATVLTSVLKVTADLTKDGRTERKEYPITLENTINHIKSEFVVTDFNVPNPVISYEPKSLGTPKTVHGMFTVADSALIVSVKFADNSTKSSNLVYQVASYKKGNNVNTFDYVPFSEKKLTAQEWVVTNLSEETVGGKTYLRRQHDKNIIFNVDGSNYTLKVSYILKKEKTGASGISHAELIRAEKNSIKEQPSSAKYNVYAVVRQYNHDGTTKDVVVSELDLVGYIEGAISDQVIPTLNMDKIKEEIGAESREEIRTSEDGYVKVYKVTRKYTTFFKHFNVSSNVVHTEVVYNDGSTVIDIPVFKHTNLASDYGVDQVIVENVEYKLEYYLAGQFVNDLQRLVIPFKIKVQ